VPAPDERRVRRLWLDRGNALVAVPQRMQVFRFELGDEGRALFCDNCSICHACYSLTARTVRYLSPRAGRGKASRLRQLGVDISAVDDDVLDKDARLDFFALEEPAEHSDPQPPPFHLVPLDP